MSDKLKSEASPFRDIAEKVAAKYFRPQEIDTAISKDLARSECTRSNEEIVRLAVEATRLTSFNHSREFCDLDQCPANRPKYEYEVACRMEELMSTMAEKERT